jgi:hypothetical protein
MNRACRNLTIVLLLASATYFSHAQLEGSKPGTKAVDHPVPAIQDTETSAQRDARMQWLRETRFGMFVHLDKLPTQGHRAYLLADKAHKPLKIMQNGNSLDVELPSKALDPIATVLILNTN